MEKINNAERLKIHYVPLLELNPAIYNPRKWDKSAEDNLTKSIKTYGLVDALVINSAPNRKMIVIGGHFRLHVAKKLGFKEVPVVFVNIPDEEIEKKLNLTLNAVQGEWDYELLKKFDIEMLIESGFDEEDLSLIWDDILSAENDEFNVEKEKEKIKETDIKIGDMFQLGNHVLGCLDSTKAESINKLLGSKKADMIYTDVIYNIGLSYNKGISGKKSYGGKTNDNKSVADYMGFVMANVKNALSVCKKDAHIFHYCDQKFINIFQNIYDELKIKNERVCLWVKNGFGVTPKNAFNKCYEPCVYGTIGKPYLSSTKNLNEILNKEIGTGNRTIDDVLDLIDIWLCKRLPGQEYEHPTQKPITLHEKPIRRCTKPGDIVVDLATGSGSTLLACEQLKRTCYTCDIDPTFIQLTINRYEKFTGQKAVKIN
jgi:DNA modification methylase